MPPTTVTCPSAASWHAHTPLERPTPPRRHTHPRQTPPLASNEQPRTPPVPLPAGLCVLVRRVKIATTKKNPAARLKGEPECALRPHHTSQRSAPAKSMPAPLVKHQKVRRHSQGLSCPGLHNAALSPSQAGLDLPRDKQEGRAPAAPRDLRRAPVTESTCSLALKPPARLLDSLMPRQNAHTAGRREQIQRMHNH